MTNPSILPPFKHILDEDVIQTTQNRYPSILRDMKNAKLILQECSADTGDSIYNHLSEIIKRIIDERPPNVIDYFEEYSHKIRDEHFRTKEPILQETYIEPRRLLIAKDLLQYLTLPSPENFPGQQLFLANAENIDKNLQLIINKDIMHLQFYWSLAGYGFPQKDIFILSCCMRKLEENLMIKNCRFWGKIFGLTKNYYIVECELNNNEIKKRREMEKENLKNKILNNIKIKKEWKKQQGFIHNEIIPKIPESTNALDTKLKQKFNFATSPLPNITYKTPKEIPLEKYGTGLNRKTYFVCNELSEEWIELPSVTPQQIVISRQIKKYFTGNLNSTITTYPDFPGTEKNYLRALIARITSSTYISPLNFYQIGKSEYEQEDNEEEEEDEEAEEEEENEVENNDKITSINLEYEPINYKDLLNTEFWIHHRPNILLQGRINQRKLKRFNKLPKNDDDVKHEEYEEDDTDDDDDDDDNDDKNENNNNDKPEIRPDLMINCSNDNFNNSDLLPWTIRLTQMYNPKNAMIVVKSNIWPGSLSFSIQNIHDNLYVGWGHKYTNGNYSPITIPIIQQEYKIGPEVMEIFDPTIEEEEAYWELMRKKNLLEEEKDSNENADEEDGSEDDLDEDDVDDNY